MRRHRFIRNGFTLVELLVVLAIISILAILTAAAVSKYITVGQNMATEATIRKVYARLMANWSAVIETAKYEPMDTVFSSSTMSQIRLMTNGDDSFTRVIYIKLRLAQEFPVSMSEIIPPQGPPTGLWAIGVSPKSAYTKLPGGIPSQYQSSVLLLASIKESRKGINTSADDFGTCVKTLPGTTVQYLVDGWGSPLQFFRWPTGCSELDGLCPVDAGLNGGNGSIVRDPQDPDGRLLSLSGPNQSKFETWCHLLHNPATSKNPYAFYTFPVIASAGPDLHPGLTTGANGPMQPDGTNADADNLYSFRLIKPGTKGGN